MMFFSGELVGRRLSVTNVHLRGSDPVQATGSCEIFYREGRISVVSCLARTRTRTYVANFLPSRI
jgi:hypothetical protein